MIANLSECACYVRVSASSQNEEGQRCAIRRWLDGNGIANPMWFSDVSSGDNLKRPGFEALQKAIFSGEVRVVICFKLDRLSRSLREGVELLCNWLDKDVRLISVSEGHDFRDATGRLIAAVLLSVSEMEQTVRRERQAEGIAVAKARGKYKGRQQGSFKASPRRAYQLRNQGLTIAEIASALGTSRRTVGRYLSKDDC